MLSILSGLLLTSCVVTKSENEKSETSHKYHITQSTDIKEIEDYLRFAHKDDQYRLFLKKKLIALKNATWMKSGQGLAMPPRTFTRNSYETANVKALDRVHFNKLLSEYKANQKQNTVNVLNELFNDSNPNSPTSIVLVQNKSACDMILTLEGPQSYDLAVPAKSETSITVVKGNYHLRSNVCEASYQSSKLITKGIVIALNYENNKPNS